MALFLYLLLGGLLFLIWELKHAWRTRNQPPGPIQLPILGNLVHLAFFGQHVPIYEYFEQLSQKYGKIFRFQGGVTSQVILSDFDLLKEVSTNPSDAGINRHTDEWLLERSYGKPIGLLFGAGEIWKESRRFVLRTLRDFGLGKQAMEDESAHEELESLLGHIEESKIDPTTRVLEMHHIFSIPVLNLIWKMVASTRFEYNDPKLLQFLSAMEKISKQYSLAGDVLMAFPKLRHVLPPLFGYGKERREYEPKLQQQFRDLLEERRAAAVTGIEPADLTDAFLDKKRTTARAHAGQNSGAYTDENFAVMAMDLFMAGAETTSNSLEFAFLYMILYPEIQERVQAEIDTVLGRCTRVEYQNLRRLPYTEATLLEVMRFATVVPFKAREISEDSRLGSYELPKGTMIVCNLHAIHFDPEFWGDPEVFRPERFLEDGGSKKKAASHAIRNWSPTMPWGTTGSLHTVCVLRLLPPAIHVRSSTDVNTVQGAHPGEKGRTHRRSIAVSCGAQKTRLKSRKLNAQLPQPQKPLIYSYH